MATVDPSRPYVDESHLEAERRRVFGASWLVAAAAWDLPRPGARTVFEALGESLIVARGDDGVVRAFHNTCRHRGSRLARGPGHGPLVCPYHGWTYATDGQRTAPGVGCDLLAVPCEERAGLVFVHLGTPTPLDDFLAGVDQELAAYRLDELTPVQTLRRPLPSNWKVLLENAIETYHVGAVHPASIGVGAPRTLDVVDLGENIRLRQDLERSPPLRDWLDRRTTRGGPYTELQRRALHKYLLFPNLVINALPAHVTLIQVFPVTATSAELRYTFARRRGAGPLERARALGSWLGSRWILHEDLSVLDDFQAGAALGRVPAHHLQPGEEAVARFQARLRRRLG